MGITVVSGATIICTMGAGSGVLNASAQTKVKSAGPLIATIQDVAPMTNICPCGMCSSMANPAVSAATSAAMGVLTPQPCTPVPTGVWNPGSTVMVGGIPALTQGATIMCSYGGTISITAPAQSVIQMK